MANTELAVHFFVQLALILCVCQVVGHVARWLRQPQVVSEMVVGFILGPSLLGLYLPAVQQQLFPKESMPIIYVVSQVGLVLYMFVVGLEFKVELIRGRLRCALSVSLAGMLTPLLLGGGLALLIHGDGRFFSPHTGRWEAMLFMGSAMCITAFPVLSRILHECRVAGTFIGVLALAAASLDDAAAWGVLARVVASFNQQASATALTVLGGVAYVAFVLLVGRPLLRRLGTGTERNEGLTPRVFVFTMGLLMLCAWVTDSIGLYAVFGAFILGAAMPRGLFVRELRRYIEPLTTSVLLPLFFIYSGLNTQLGLVATPFLWAVMLAVIVVACVGKGFACWLAARANGETQRDSLSIGALMNARGLTELILLNIALERGIITPTLFTIMALMAVVTTLMASPLFNYFYFGTSRLSPAQGFEPAPAAVGLPAAAASEAAD